MGARETSIKVYYQILNEGLLSKMRFQVYEALFKIGKPSTAREIFETMNLAKMEPTRLTELRNLGVIYEKGVRECLITGRNVIEYDLTDKLPVKQLKKLTGRPQGFIKVVKYMIKEMEKKDMNNITIVQLKNILKQ